MTDVALKVTLFLLFVAMTSFKLHEEHMGSEKLALNLIIVLDSLFREKLKFHFDYSCRVVKIIL